MTRKHPLAICEKCELADKRCAPSTGSKSAKVAVVSRSPGKSEAISGKVFSGTSGKVLNALLGEHGYERKDILATNVVLCETEKPSKNAIECCAPRLDSEIGECKTIIACGTEAVQTLTGARGVHSARGYAHTNERGQRIIATFNPAAALHKTETYPDLVKDFRLALSPPPPAQYPQVRWTDDVTEAKSWVRTILQDGLPNVVGVDIESFGLAHTAGLASFAISGQDGRKAIAFGLKIVSDTDFVRNYLRPLLEQPDTQYIWHNGKFDVKNLRTKNVPARVDEDTMLLSYVLDERPGTHSLEYVAMDVLGWDNYEPPSVKKFKRSRELHAEGRIENPEELYVYNAYDAAATVQLYPLLRERAAADSVMRPYEQLLLPASRCFTQIELAGVHYDANRAADIWEQDIMPLLWRWREEMAAIADLPALNPNSSQQVAAWIYDTCGAVVSLDRKGKERSVDKAVRTEILEDRFFIRSDVVQQATRSKLKKFCKLLTDWKGLDKQRGTYIEGIIRVLGPDGKVYTSFKEIGTETGRLSSKAPNLQNLTRIRPGMPNIRALFVSSPGRTILSADYSQAELRTIAVFSGDTKLLSVYEKGLDLHSITARRFYGENFTKEQRSLAKNCNFGGFYGQTAKTFQEKHGIPEKDAQPYLEWMWEEFTEVAAWVEEIEQRILTDGFLVTPFGRKKRFHLITNYNKAAAFREGVNFMVQSTAHDFTLWSLIELHRQFDPKDCQIFVEVHDSIGCDVETNYMPTAGKLLKTVMESAPKETIGWTLPFTVDLAAGPSWGEVEELAA